MTSCLHEGKPGLGRWAGAAPLEEALAPSPGGWLKLFLAQANSLETIPRVFSLSNSYWLESFFFLCKLVPSFFSAV